MAHMVIFQGTDGSPGYHQCEGIDDAVKFVEELRNDRGIDRARIFRMEEVEFEFRPYWFVVQREGEAAAVTPPTVAPAMPAPAPSTLVAAPESPSTPDASGSDEASAVDEEPEREPELEVPVPAAGSPLESFAPPPPPPSRGLFGR